MRDRKHERQSSAKSVLKEDLRALKSFLGLKKTKDTVQANQPTTTANHRSPNASTSADPRDVITLPVRPKAQEQSHSRQVGLTRPNHNPQPTPNCDITEHGDSAPGWYIRYPETKDTNDSGYLCNTCRHIDLGFLFFKAKPAKLGKSKDYISLGPYHEIARESKCAFCVLVALTITATIPRNSEGKLIIRADTEHLVKGNWYLTPFRYLPYQYAQGYQLFLRQDVGDAEETTDLGPTWPYVLRVLMNRPRGGRQVNPNHLDYDWIARTVARCELSTDMPPQRFSAPLRVVDVDDMCIVPLPKNGRYIALSYTWGNVETAKLSIKNTEILQTSNSLTGLPNIPQTTRDAMEIVRQVGQRYLWVDSLCVTQDDPIDLQQQLSQMGDVYRHAYFAIVALCGDNANHGLPGVRPGSRTVKQHIVQIGNLYIANSLPWLDSEDYAKYGLWSSRGWTFQESFHAQRQVYIAEDVMFFQCLHTSTPEDENCFHTPERDKRANMIGKGTMFFYDGMDHRSKPFIGGSEVQNFDLHSLFIREYTKRNLTFQSDAERAFLGIIRTLENRFDCEYIHGLPEVEFDAALLWSPLGAGNFRRCDPVTKKALFPSWSWLGWIGIATYPWTLERDTFMSIENSPLEWSEAYAAAGWQLPRGFDSSLSSDTTSDDFRELWFTSDDLCLPRSNERSQLLHIIRSRTKDHLGARRTCDMLREDRPESLDEFLIDWPTLRPPQWQYVLNGSHRLRLRTLCNNFRIIGKPWKRARPFDTMQSIWRLSIIDKEKCLVGYIDVPDPEGGRHIKLGYRRFIVLSRSTIDGQYEPGPHPLGRSMRREEMALRQDDPIKETTFEPDLVNCVPKSPPHMVHPVGHFDGYMYPDNRPWAMFNVMMLDWSSSELGMCAVRDAIGRIHVDAFLANRPWMEIIDLE